MYKIINVFKNDDLIHTLLSVDDKILNLGMSVDEYLKSLGIEKSHTPYRFADDQVTGHLFYCYRVDSEGDQILVRVTECVELSKEDPKTKRIQKAIFENFNPKIGMALKKDQMFNGSYRWSGDTLYKCGENAIGDWVEDPICNGKEWLEAGGYHFVVIKTEKDSFASYGEEVEIKDLLKDYKGSTYHKSGRFLLIDNPIDDTFYMYETLKENPENLAAKQAVFMNTQNQLGFAIWENDMYGSGYFISDDILFQNINSRSHFICTKDEWLEAGGVVSTLVEYMEYPIFVGDDKGQMLLGDFIEGSREVKENILINDQVDSKLAIVHKTPRKFDVYQILHAKDPKFFTKLFGDK